MMSLSLAIWLSQVVFFCGSNYEIKPYVWYRYEIMFNPQGKMVDCKVTEVNE